MTRDELESDLYARIIGDRGNSVKLIADFILANFTPKGEAEKVSAAKMYEILIHSAILKPDCSVHFNELAKEAHEAARSFNEYKPG